MSKDCRYCRTLMRIPRYIRQSFPTISMEIMNAVMKSPFELMPVMSRMTNQPQKDVRKEPAKLKAEVNRIDAMSTGNRPKMSERYPLTNDPADHIRCELQVVQKTVSRQWSFSVPMSNPIM